MENDSSRDATTNRGPCECREIRRDKRKIWITKLLSPPEKGGVMKQKRSIQNWISNHHTKFMDRPNKTDGFKTVSERISFHGLRHAYAQRRYNKFLSEGMCEKEARLAVSEELGHHRDDVTRTYSGK